MDVRGVCHCFALLHRMGRIKYLQEGDECVYCGRSSWVTIVIALIVGLLLALILPFAMTLLIVLVAGFSIWLWNCRR